MFHSPASSDKEKTLPITVALIIHGEPPKIMKTVESIKNQTYPSSKITIMCLDDGSSPKARRLLLENGMKVYDMPKNCNISCAKNFSLKNSEDEIVFFLDDHIILDRGSVAEIARVFTKYPHIAGVCGYYRSANFDDYNILRDIKRQTIYGKNRKERFITLDTFTTFSTGIAAVKKSIFMNLDFPEDVFPNDFGGEDVPALITALNQGQSFYYSPKIRGVHEHNLSVGGFIRKMETEIRGRFSLLYWASNNPEFRIPYLHGFLNFPYFFLIALLMSLVLAFISPYFLLIPFLPFLYEVGLSLQCLSAKNIPLRHKIKASLFVLLSDFLSVVCFIQYLLSSYKRPYKKLGIKRFLRINKIFLRWELEKYHMPHGK